MKISTRFSRGAVAVAAALALTTTAVSPATADDSDATTAGLAAISTGSAGVGSYAGSAVISFGVPLLILALVYNMAIQNGAVQGAPVAIPGLPR